MGTLDNLEKLEKLEKREILIGRLAGSPIDGSPVKGGAGSGYFGHAGRPGERGGSIDDGIPNDEGGGDVGGDVALSFSPSSGVDSLALRGDDVGVPESVPEAVRGQGEFWPNTEFGRRALIDAMAGSNSSGRQLPAYSSVPYGPSDDLIERAALQAERMVVDGSLEDRVAMFRKVVSENPVSVRVQAKDVKRVLEAGRLATQFETGKSNGTYKPNFRSEVESVYMGVPKDIDPALRPVYGFISHGNAQTHYYGNVELVLKESVKDRTTVTWGDSLRKPAARSHVAARISDLSDDRKASAVLGATATRMAGSDAAAQTMYTYSDPYIEAQIHGGLSLADVDHVVIHDYGKNDPALRSAAKRLRAVGFEVEVKSMGGVKQ